MKKWLALILCAALMLSVCSFAAADETGGAFNGLTLVGGFPDYKPAGTAFIFR